AFVGVVGCRHGGEVVAGVGRVMAGTAWLAVWSCFDWRYGIAGPVAGARPPAWDRNLTKLPASGFGPGLVRFMQRHRLLPEGYLDDLAVVVNSLAVGQRAYLMGAYSDRG